MNKDELLQALRQEGVRDDAFDLDGGHLSETYTLSESSDRWFVYYSERGLESGKKDFDTQSAACEYFFNLLKNDPTTRKGYAKANE
jgi:sugar/nucleoside kinase (ribokinase family)